MDPIPYFDLAGYKLRTKVDPRDVDLCESKFPGYLRRRISIGSQLVNDQLHKRYLVPLGQLAPTLVAFGTLPPSVTLQGRPTLGSLEMVIQITTPGVLGVAVFQWSSDGGQTFTTTVVTAATVALGATGLTAVFPSGNYAADNAWTAPTPIPEIVLGWLVTMVDIDVWDRRGVNPQDPGLARGLQERERADAQIANAANSEVGLFDLPTNDAAGDSAIKQGGPMFYSEASPYAWQDQQRCEGRREDRSRTGQTITTEGT